ncbi:SocA family protein [Flavobacterium sp. CYK-4]|uniref:Panacea domain-containing protein n=1 Tax=Flavobacterium lotistagni TaxID=2709660 RepID=UPI001409392A|nr:Panacea domain-containing protein [Flavobacterium lotistagni]NHM08334.1 SocA family protein [Flavobacterium lotistagni]
MVGFKLNIEKALTALLYVSSELGSNADFHKTFKILYFADQKHLVRYGRPIIGDLYVKMKYGPVPSYIKNVVDGNIEQYSNIVEVYNRIYMRPIQKFDLDYLSASDLECLAESIRENKDLSFDDLTRKSHDAAWNGASWPIDYLEVLKAGSENESDMLSYVKANMLNNNIMLS